jgi:small subunit ribosomal protein S2
MKYLPKSHIFGSIAPMIKAEKDTVSVDDLFKVGAHFGYNRTRRHPSTKKFIFGRKNNVEIFDLEKVQEQLEKTKDFVKSLARDGKTILFVSSKKESQSVIKDFALKIDVPFVSGRWIGGVLTNFPEIRKRVDRYQQLISEREKGELAKYTKKERLLIEREIIKLEEKFAGIVSLNRKPAAIFIVDPKKEKNALAEAFKEKVTIISLANSDCNISGIQYPIVANDSSIASVRFFVDQISKAYSEGKREKRA